LGGDPAAVPPGIDLPGVRAALDGPAAERAAEAFLAQCVSLQCAAALDVEIEHQLRRLGPDAERFVEEFRRAEGL
jgi:hypothetical protein